MVAPSKSSTKAKRVLVLQPDTHTRNLISDQLQNHGFHVDACNSLAQAKAHYNGHPLVISSVEKDPHTPRGFITWVREMQPQDEDQPYIVAVGDNSTALITPPSERLWDEILTIPLSHAELRTRLEAIEPKLKIKEPEEPAAEEVESFERAKEAQGAPKTASQEGLELKAEVVSPPPPKEAPAKPNPLLTESYFYPGIEWSGAVGDRERCQALVDNMPISMAMFDTEMRYLVVNRHWVKDYGLEGVDLVGRCHYEVFPQIGTEWKVVFDLALKGETRKCQEDLWIRADCRQDWVTWEVKPWFTAKKEIGGVTFTCQTIRNKNPEQPEDSELEPFAKSLMRGNLTPVLCLDMDGTIRQANQAAKAFVDDPGMKIVGELYWEVFSLPEKRGKMRRDFLELSEQTRQSNFFLFPQNMADTVRLSSGRIATLVWSVSPRQDSTGGIAGVILVGVILDRNALRSPLDNTSTQPVAEGPPRDIAHYTEHPEEILERVSFGIILLDKERNTIYANPEHHRMIGYDIRDYSDIEEWLRAAAPEGSDADELLQTWREAVWQRQSIKTVTLLAKNQMLRDIEFRPRPTSEGGTILTIFDVTEKRQGEEMLRASEAKFRALFFHAGLPIVLEDANGRFSSANPSFERLINVANSDLSRYGMRDWVHPDDWPELEASIGQLKTLVPEGPSASLTIRMFREGGDYVKVHATISRIVDQTGKLVFTAYLFQDTVAAHHNVEDGEELIQAMRHRIRNDLQMICSLASIQLTHTASPQSRQILRQSQERIQTIAHLYQLMGATTAMPTGICASSFLNLQRNTILRTYDADTNKLVIRLVCEDITLAPNQALTLGFVVSEVLGEVFRSAIGRGHPGAAVIRLKITNNLVEFRIEDDGLEFPDTLWRADEENSIAEVLQALASQLQAELLLVPGPTSSVTLRFGIVSATEGP